MATFKRDDLEQSVHGHVLNTREIYPEKREGTKAMAGRRGKRSMAESEALIRAFILEAEEPVTMLQILDHIERASAPHLRRIVSDLVKTGEVVKGEDLSIGGNLPRFWYWHP